MDLFTPVVPPERQHPNFRFLTSIELSGPERAVLQDWATGFQDRDGKFVKEFQTTYNSSFWELYLFAAFKELGCSVDFRYSSPDFVVDSPVGEFVAEATIASHPDGYTPEWERHIDINAVFDVNREELLTVATIRLANAITSKHRKYTNSYAKLPHVQGKPFVICLAPFEQPFFFLQNDLAIRRVLYAFDRHLYQDDRATGTRIVFGATTTESVGKDNGASVPMGLFTRPGMEEVSAVLFSNTATYTKVRALAGEGPYPVLFFAARYNADDLEPRMIELPRPQYSETVLDGLHLCLNPFATHPIDPSLFAERGSSLHTFDSSAEEHVSWSGKAGGKGGGKRDGSDMDVFKLGGPADVRAIFTRARHFDFGPPFAGDPWDDRPTLGPNVSRFPSAIPAGQRGGLVARCGEALPVPARRRFD